jgi:small subunit ribosomal protein S4
MLEQRVDNVVFRSGFARTRPQARQLVNHGHVLVNGQRVTIPSFRVRKGDVVEISAKAKKMIIVQHNADTLDRIPPMWLDVSKSDFKAEVRDLPLREQIDVPVREQLIVELYSK